jgi:molecular chaperone Hsp33
VGDFLILLHSGYTKRQALIFNLVSSLATLAGGATQGRLAITLDPKDGGPLYQGIVGLEAASIASLIQHYLTSSEQIESRLVLASAGGHARGLLLQRMQSAGPEDEATWQRAAACADAMTPHDLLAAADPQSLLLAAFRDEEVRLFKPHPARFACGCSEERIANALRLLGRAEVESILAEQGMVGVTCEFCNRRYTFLADEARALFDRDESGAGTRDETTSPAIRH